MWGDRARRILGRAAGPEPSAGPLLDRVPSNDEWFELTAVANRERVAPALGRAVAAGLIPATPEQQSDAAERWATAMRACLRIEAALLWLTDELAHRGIELRVLKGPAAAHLDHPSPERRQFGDLDVLVRGEDLAGAFDLLRASGYARRFPEPRPGFDRRFMKSASFRGAIEIDVHRTVAEGPIGHRIPPAELWVTSREFSLGGGRMFALGDVARFVHACLHAHLGPPPERLSTLSDIATALAAPAFPAAEAAELADRWRVGAVVASAVRAAARDISASGPAQAWPVRDPGRWERTLIASHRVAGTSSAIRELLSLATVPGLTDKLRYGMALAVPERSYFRGRHRGRLDRGRYAADQVARSVTGGHDG